MFISLPLSSGDSYVATACGGSTSFGYLLQRLARQNEQSAISALCKQPFALEQTVIWCAFGNTLGVRYA